jgi:hypothetical protein
VHTRSFSFSSTSRKASEIGLANIGENLTVGLRRAGTTYSSIIPGSLTRKLGSTRSIFKDEPLVHIGVVDNEGESKMCK